MNKDAIVINVYRSTPIDDAYDSSDDDFCAVGNAIDDYLNLVDPFDVTGIDNDNLDDAYEEAYNALTEGLPVLEKFNQRAFIDILDAWAKHNGTTIERMVRGYARCGYDSFYMIHGIGYDWMSDDLFGGTANGEARRDFDKFTRDEYNVTFSFDYYI